MTSNSLPVDGDPRQLLAETRSLARQVRHDQRLTWVALLVLAVVTFVAIPVDWFGMEVDCDPTGVCRYDRLGTLWFWPPALALAYTFIAVSYTRAARARGVGARVLPYVITGAVLTGVFLAAWILIRVILPANPGLGWEGPIPYWYLVLDRLVAPWGTIGIALLVLARIERNVALFAFSVAYLVIVLVPVDFGWESHSSVRMEYLPQQVINGLVLLLGSAGFYLADRRRDR